MLQCHERKQRSFGNPWRFLPFVFYALFVVAQNQVTPPESTATFQRFEPKEDFAPDNMMIPEPPAVRQHNLVVRKVQQTPSYSKPASRELTTPMTATSSVDDFSPTSRILRRLMSGGSRNDEEHQIVPRGRVHDDTQSDVPSDELNAMMSSMEQDLEGFGNSREPVPTSSASKYASPSSSSPSYPHYRQQAYNNYTMNYTLPQQQQQHYQHHQQQQQPPYSSSSSMWSTPERKPSTTRGPPSPPQYYPDPATPRSDGGVVSPSSSSSFNSYEMDNGIATGDKDIDANILEYLKERRRIKRVTRKHRAERKQPPVTMEV
jgi:hypothetical protein